MRDCAPDGCHVCIWKELLRRSALNPTRSLLRTRTIKRLGSKRNFPLCRLFAPLQGSLHPGSRGGGTVRQLTPNIGESRPDMTCFKAPGRSETKGRIKSHSPLNGCITGGGLKWQCYNLNKKCKKKKRETGEKTLKSHAKDPR